MKRVGRSPLRTKREWRMGGMVGFEGITKRKFGEEGGEGREECAEFRRGRRQGRRNG